MSENALYQPNVIDRVPSQDELVSMIASGELREQNNQQDFTHVLRSGERTSFAPEIADGVSVAAIIRTTATETAPSDDLVLMDLRGVVADERGAKHVNGAEFAASTQFLLLDMKTFNADARTGFKGIRPGQAFTYGRPTEALLKKNPNDARLRFQGADKEYTSREHFTIEVDNGGQVTIADHSANGTTVYGGKDAHMQALRMELTDNADSHAEDHTMSAQELARLIRGESDTFAGREIINRHTTNPEGKVDIRAWVAGGEAIVVDSQKVPGPYKALQEKFIDSLKGIVKSEPGVDKERAVVGAIYDAVHQTMKYDLQFTDDFAKKLDPTEDGHRKVNLAAYLGAGKGVCRHMGLAATWLGARIAEAGMVEGVFTTPVNQRTADNAAHEWARFTSASGEVYIIDPAQNFFGTLAEAQSRPGSWEYRSAEERHQAKVDTIANGIAGLHFAKAILR